MITGSVMGQFLDKVMDEASKAITLRKIPADIDTAITEQASLTGKSKNDLVLELLTSTFGDLLGNFVRSSELVALMDKEVARMTDREVILQSFESNLTPIYNREYCRILALKNEDDLKRVLMNNIPYLELRSKQLRFGMVPFLPKGISLIMALFCEVAGRDGLTIAQFYTSLWFVVEREQYYRAINEIRAVKSLLPVTDP
ncbi:TPA: hypothetical protein MCA18_005403 [Klebsiella pneumoniae]|nr:hypothetical protein [Klebsiella pneumoniae]MCB8050974.1 hypothetical protein [Klebsiella pneumoniae]MCB8056612.1 hypothetical protein [Klebsiella pneumoniae]HBR4330653.1 hypothetical protein [Klebsiella pneumoniae]HBT5537170.1 hypothetical protein [Klebsiella pneumoniae]